MDLVRAAVLGVIQGLTEFLPISSSAHLIIVPWLFGWEPFGLAFDVALHLGTLAAVISYFRRDLLSIGTAVVRSRNDLVHGRLPGNPMGRMGVYIALGTIPAVVVGLAAEGAIDAFFHDGSLSPAAIAVVALMLILVGLLLGLADRRTSTLGGISNPADVNFRTAMVIGIAQSVALIPGVSRSGSTITAGLFQGMSRPAAARFSFLLGVPIVAGAGTMQIYELASQGMASDEYAVFGVGMLTAAIVGYLAIAGLLRFLQRRSTAVFVLYRLALGLGLLLAVAIGFGQ